MEMDIFAEKVQRAVKEELGEDYKVDVKDVRKNNGVCRKGLIILAEDSNVTPTIYLESFMEAYESGMDFSRIISQIVQSYQGDMVKKNIDMDFFRQFEMVRDRICYRLVGREGNEALLAEVPHIEFLDLAICFYYSYYNEAIGEGSILLHHSHAAMWDTSTQELFQLARRNTPGLFPWKYGSVREMLQENEQSEHCGEEIPFEDSIPDEIPMKILTNNKRMNGASAVLYPGVLENVASRMGGDLYIIPSSVHEVILLPYDGMQTADELKRMISEINDTQLVTEEILSYSLYHYDFQKKKMELV